MNGGSYNNSSNGQNNYHRNRNNSNQGTYNNNNSNSGQNSFSNAGGNYQNNRYNNNSNNNSNTKGATPNGGGGLGGGTGPVSVGVMNGQQKDVAPRFKRTMMGSGGPGGIGGGGGHSNNTNSPRDNNNYHGSGGAGGGIASPGDRQIGPNATSNAMSSSTSSASSATGENNSASAAASPGVESLQMRPSANSLLFKANTMNVNKLPLSQPQQRVIPTNSMLAAQSQSQQQQNQPPADKASNGGPGSQVYQGRDSSNSNSPFKSSPLGGNNSSGSGGNERKKDQGLLIMGRGGVMAREQQEMNKDKDQQQTSSGVVSGQKKKKDKGVSKEEVLKRFGQFLEETYFQRMVKRVGGEEEEEKEEVVAEEVVVKVEEVKEPEEQQEEKNAVDQLESEKKEEVVEGVIESTEKKTPEVLDEEKKELEAENIVKAEEEKKVEIEVEVAKVEVAKVEVVVPVSVPVVVVAKKPKQPVEREQTLAAIVQAYVDLKVPDKFVKDCLASLYAVSVEREMQEEESPKAISDSLLREDASESVVATWWSLSIVERCVVFVDQLKQHQKLGNNVAESLKQTLQTVAVDTPKQLPWLTKLLAVAVLFRVYGLSELAALTEHGKYYPLMLDTLQRLNGGDAEAKKRLVELFGSAKVDLLQVLPENERNKEQLVAVLDDRGLDFLCPLLKVQSQMWKQIKVDSNPQQFYKWIKENVDAAYFVEEGFIQALVTVLLKQITQVREKSFVSE